MDRFISVLSSFLAALMMVAIPVPSLAMGFGFGVRAHHASAAARSQSGSSIEEDDDAEVEIKAENRCKKLSGDDQTRCLELVKLQMTARGEHKDRSHGKLMSALRHRIKDVRSDVREDGGNALARARVVIAGFMDQLRTAFHAEAKIVLDVCKDKTGDERETCIAAAKVKLQAKVTAAIEAMK